MRTFSTVAFPRHVSTQIERPLNKGANARKRKVKVGRKMVTAKAMQTRPEYELQKNLTFQTEMSEGHQQELAEEVKSKKEVMRLLQKRQRQWSSRH